MSFGRPHEPRASSSQAPVDLTHTIIQVHSHTTSVEPPDLLDGAIPSCPQEAMSGQSSDSSPEEEIFPRPKNWMNIYNAAYYIKYSLAAYSWPLYIYMNPATGCCKLWRDCGYVGTFGAMNTI